MTTLCVCGAPTSEDAYLCSTCVDDIGRALTDVAELSDELDLSLSKQRRFVIEPSGSAGTVSPLPFDVGASRAIHELRAELVGLVRVCVDHHVASRDYIDADPDDTLPSISRWLLWRVDGMAAQPWAADVLRLVRIVEHCTKVIDRPADRTFAGPCDACGQDLYVEPGRPDVICFDCGLAYDLAARRAWLLSVVNDRLATAIEIARALTSLSMPVNAERVRQWKHRGRLVERAHDRRGRPLFRVGDVVDLLLEHADAGSALLSR